MKYIYMILGASLMIGTLVLASLILSDSINSNLSEGLLASTIIILIGFLPGILYFLHSLKTEVSSKLMFIAFWLHVLSIVYSLVTYILLLTLISEPSLEIVMIFFSVPVFIIGTIFQIVYFFKSKIKHPTV